MERSQSGYIEPMTRRSRAKAERVQLIIHAISDRFTSEPFPAMSEHYKGEIAPQPQQVGFNSQGDYVSQGGRWDDMGNSEPV